MAIAQADGYEAVFKLPDGSEAALPVIVWSGGVGAITGLVNQADLEALLGKRFNYGIDYTGLVTPCGYPEFQRYRKAGLERCETQDEPKTNLGQTFELTNSCRGQIFCKNGGLDVIEKGESSELLERLTKEQRQQFGSIIKALLDLKDSPKYQTLLTMLGEKRPMPVIIDFINNEKGGDSGAQVDSSLS